MIGVVCEALKHHYLGSPLQGAHLYRIAHIVLVVIMIFLMIKFVFLGGSLICIELCDIQTSDLKKSVYYNDSDCANLYLGTVPQFFRVPKMVWLS